VKIEGGVLLGPVPDGKLAANRRHSSFLRDAGGRYSEMTELPPLAVAGGGPSLRGELEHLRQWDGEIWAVGSTYRWLRNQGVDCRFFCCDASPKVADWAKGAEMAVLASECDPGTFEAVGSARVFDLEPGMHGSTSATAAPYLATIQGSPKVTFFGCDSSFSPGVATHVNKDRPKTRRIKVAAAGSLYETTVEYLMQAKFLAEVIIRAPERFASKSSGLLKAMISDIDYDIVALTADLWDHLETLDGRPYKEICQMEPWNA
jgi:hypothetical protein